MQRFFRPEKLVHALNLLKGQIKSINDNLFLGKKKQMDMYWMEFQGKTVFKIKSLTSQLL